MHSFNIFIERVEPCMQAEQIKTQLELLKPLLLICSVFVVNNISFWNNCPINIFSHWFSPYTSIQISDQRIIPQVYAIILVHVSCKQNMQTHSCSDTPTEWDLFHRPLTSTSNQHWYKQKEPWWWRPCFLNNNSCINIRFSQLKGSQHQKAVKYRTLNPSFFEETRLKRGVSSYGWMKWEFSCNKRTSSPRKD